MNQLSKLLLVDPDRRGLETLKYGFEREGCTVAGTSDPHLAPELLRTITPQLAVVSLRASDKSGLDLISGLRGKTAGHKLPVVTLGPPPMKTAALAAGASDFLPTPLFLRDVVTVSRLLALAPASASDAATGEGVAHDGDARDGQEIHGRLSEYGGVYYLVRAMAATGRSGILLLSRGNRKAEVRFSDGAVRAAHVAAQQGLPALHHLLLWEEAALSLKLREVPRRGQLVLSAHDLLDECERFLRDFTYAARDLGSPRTVYVASEPAARASGLQPGQLAPVLRLLDGHRALADVIEESSFRIFDTLRVIKRLIDAGALTALPEGNGHPPANERPPRWLMEPWALVPDQHGVLPDRRRGSSRRIKPLPSPLQLSATGSAPIPLTVKKAATASGEIHARKRLRTPPVPLSDPLGGSTVHVTSEVVRAPTPAPLAAAPAAPPPARHPTPAPLAAAPAAPPPARHPTPAPLRERTPPPAAARAHVAEPPPQPAPRAESRPRLKKVPSQPHVDPATAFDDVEADFFAREADLYKPVAVESFEDLEQPGDPAKRPSSRGRKKR